MIIIIMVSSCTLTSCSTISTFLTFSSVSSDCPLLEPSHHHFDSQKLFACLRTSSHCPRTFDLSRAKPPCLFRIGSTLLSAAGVLPPRLFPRCSFSITPMSSLLTVGYYFICVSFSSSRQGSRIYILYTHTALLLYLIDDLTSH